MSLALLLLAVADPAPAATGYRGLGWNRSQAEVLAALPGTEAVESSPGETVLKSDYGARGMGDYAGIPVEIRYFFQQDRLTVVKLIPTDAADCKAIGDKAQAELGAGTADKPFLPAGVARRDVTWRWTLPATGSKAIYSDTDMGTLHLCHLLFQRL